MKKVIKICVCFAGLLIPLAAPTNAQAEDGWYGHHHGHHHHSYKYWVPGHYSWRHHHRFWVPGHWVYRY